jgi:hypothetical protein
MAAPCICLLLVMVIHKYYLLDCLRYKYQSSFDASSKTISNAVQRSLTLRTAFVHRGHLSIRENTIRRSIWKGHTHTHQTPRRILNRKQHAIPRAGKSPALE